MRDTRTIVIQPDRGLFRFDLQSLWEYRELLFFLTWREVSIRYKQALIGFSWAIVQPVVSMVVFTLIFGRLANIPSDDVPYAIFSFTGLLPWQYFASALSGGGTSLTANANIITKVYFPRLIVPLVSVLAPLVEFAIAFVVLLCMMPFFGILPTWRILTVPFLLIGAMIVAFAVSLWLSALNVKYRDVGHAIPFLIQLWMYLSPVVYPPSLIPKSLLPLYALNPMTSVINSFRWALLGTKFSDINAAAIGSGIVLMILFSGLLYFNRTERTFADII